MMISSDIQVIEDFGRNYIGSNYCAGTKEFDDLWSELPLERRADAPRFEAWFSDAGEQYGYGRGAGARVYMSNTPTLTLLVLKRRVQGFLGTGFDGCFVNGYRDGRDHLGWHSDDSPEMDDSRPIAIVSFGDERELQFRRKGTKGHPEHSITTKSGSLIVMPPFLQDQYEHRIAKAGRIVLPRLSFTFRGVVS